MNSIKLKSSLNEVNKLFCSFGKYIRSEEVRNLSRKHPNDFVRVYKFPWYDALLYLIFRNEKCVQSELSDYYNAIGKPKLRISKQALFKAINKIDYKVFETLIYKFAQLFYSSDLVKTYKGYVLLAEDGTTLQINKTAESLKEFGYAKNVCVKTEEDATKAVSRSAALYDVTNGLIIDFSMNPYKKSEIPIAIEQLERSHHLLHGLKAIYMCDRYYDSVELFSILEGYSFKYCARAKSNFFKKYVKQMKTNDEWITVKIDETWKRRLKYEQPKQRFLENDEIKIRVVKYTYRYKDKYGKIIETDMMYFTNLSEEEFSTEEIASLYSKRWDIETSYKTLKSDMEWERYFSKECDIERCSIYAKVLLHNINGIIRKEMDDYLIEDAIQNNNQYIYQTNIAQLSKMLTEGGVCRWIRSQNNQAIDNLLETIYLHLHKIKVPIRKNRHFKRWGRHISRSHPFRYRLDGRQWPNVVYVNGHLQTIRP